MRHTGRLLRCLYSVQIPATCLFSKRVACIPPVHQWHSLPSTSSNTCHKRLKGVQAFQSFRAEAGTNTIAVVRGVPDSFEKSLCMSKPSEPINVDKARQQHAAYVDVLRGLVQEVIEIPADERYPDCPFIEDTAVVIGSRALLTRPGAPSRQGEQEATSKVLEDLGLHVTVAEPPARIDGGDVLFTNGRLYVGLSTRTDEGGVAALRSAFPDVEVVALPMGPGGLHLKSVLSRIADSTLAVEENDEALQLFDAVRSHDDSLRPVFVPDVGAANTLLVKNSLLFPCAYSDSSKIYKSSVKQAIAVDLSEFHKADGGMTCLSLIIGHH